MNRAILLTLGIVLAGASRVAGPLRAQSVYQLPSDDNGCPGNCRSIPWQAGSDLWNNGSLPAYPGTICPGLTEGNGTTDNTSAIQSCINSAAANTAVVIPAGMYYVNGSIRLKSGVVLRGAGGGAGSRGLWLSSTNPGDSGSGSKVTTLKYGPNGGISTPSSRSLGSPVLLSGGFQKGSRTITASSTSGFSDGDFIVVSERQGDTSIPTSWTGEDGACTWCGESNNSGYMMSQIVQITGISGSSISISRPMYYTFQAGLSPRIRKLTGTTIKAGVEGMKLNGSTTSRTSPHINLDGCVYCWVDDVETYNTPDVGKAYPIYMQDSYGVEIRDSYFHYGQGNGGDRNYGIGMFGPNSDHKVENNILRENRHGWSQEGGGSGNVFLYNYVDDQYTDDPSYLGSPRANHGAHPYMTLFEGNIVSHFAADDYWGTSSHATLYRNWIWGDATGNYPGWTSSSPSWGFIALEINSAQHFYSVVGNVLGRTGLHTSWSNATLLNNNCSWSASRTSPVVMALGCAGNGSGTLDTAVRSTTILHGNYDFKSNGVAFWDGGSNHSLKASIYYANKPGFFGGCAWPAFGPDLNPVTGTLPAKARYEGAGSCQVTTARPQPPTNLKVTF